MPRSYNMQLLSFKTVIIVIENSNQLTNVNLIEPIHILLWRYSITYGGFVDVVWKRKLNKKPINCWVAVETVDQLQ